MINMFYRTFSYLTIKGAFRIDHFITFTLPISMYFLGNANFCLVLKIWVTTLASSSFLMGFIGTTSGHHHPKVYHEGDELP